MLCSSLRLAIICVLDPRCRMRDKPGVFHAIVLRILRRHPTSYEWKEVRAVEPDEIYGSRRWIRRILQ